MHKTCGGQQPIIAHAVAKQLNHDNWHACQVSALFATAGSVPASWSQWGGNTIQNSLQMSLTETELRGQMPRPWVEQFCIANVQASQPLLVYQPVMYTPPALEAAQAIPLGNVLALPARNASINVTIGGKFQGFDYNHPGSICGIPHAVRNAALVWGIFTVLLVLTMVGIKLWFRPSNPDSKPIGCLPCFRCGAILGFAAAVHQRMVDALEGPKLDMLRAAAERVWFCGSDLAWNIHSQVADAITIHQVIKSGQMAYAYILLGILLIPYAVIFLVLGTKAISVSQARVAQKSLIHKLAAFLAGVVLAPVFFVVCMVALVLHGLGISLPAWFDSTTHVDLYSLYRLLSIAEAFLNALPQSILQTKLYLMGNDPDGVHVYINTWLYLYSVTSSLISIIKTVALFMFEQHRLGCSVADYFVTLLRLECLEMYREFKGTSLTRADICRAQVAAYSFSVGTL